MKLANLSTAALFSLVFVFGLKNVFAQNFPEKLLAELPESAAALNSPDVRDRASIMKKLVVAVPQSCTGEKTLPVKLDKEDYEFVVGRILELDLSALNYREDAEIWSDTEFLITKFGMRRHLETLTKYLDHPERSVQGGIVYAIYALKAKELDYKLVPLLRSPDKFIREESLRTLIYLESKKAVPALIGMLADPDHNKRHYALTSLVKVNGIEAAPAVSRLLSDENENIRYWAIDALVKLNAKSQSPQLWKYAETETVPRHVGFAHAALLYFGDRKAVPIALEAFKDSAKNGEGNQILEFIYQLKPKILIPEIIALYHQKERFYESNEYEKRMRLNINNLIIHYRTPEATAIYRENLFKLNSYDRGKNFNESVAQILLELKAVEAVDDLIAGLQDLRKDKNLQYYDLRVGIISYYLAKFGDKKANPLLIEVAAENNSHYRGLIIAELNRQLNPELWKKLDGEILPLIPVESIETFAEKAAVKTGILISFEKAPESEKILCLTDDFFLKNGIPCAYASGGISALKSLEFMFSDRRNRNYTWIFDNGAVRILTVEKAVDWWRKNVLAKN